MMDLNEFAQEVHALAAVKGFYDLEHSDAELIAAIHSEISEAFEEWRAGRPMAYHLCLMDGEPCDGPESCGYQCAYFGGDAARMNPKPEGVAVELIDVALRVLDAAAAWGVNADISKNTAIGFDEATLPEIVSYLHSRASEVYEECCESGLHDPIGIFGEMIAVIFSWIRAHDIDPEALLREKHAYNMSRPYKHGGKRV